MCWPGARNTPWSGWRRGRPEAPARAVGRAPGAILPGRGLEARGRGARGQGPRIHQRGPGRGRGWGVEPDPVGQVVPRGMRLCGPAHQPRGGGQLRAQPMHGSIQRPWLGVGVRSRHQQPHGQQRQARPPGRAQRHRPRGQHQGQGHPQPGQGHGQVVGPGVNQHHRGQRGQGPGQQQAEGGPLGPHRGGMPPHPRGHGRQRGQPHGDGPRPGIPPRVGGERARQGPARAQEVASPEPEQQVGPGTPGLRQRTHRAEGFLQHLGPVAIRVEGAVGAGLPAHGKMLAERGPGPSLGVLPGMGGEHDEGQGCGRGPKGPVPPPTAGLPEGDAQQQHARERELGPNVGDQPRARGLEQPGARPGRARKDRPRQRGHQQREVPYPPVAVVAGGHQQAQARQPGQVGAAGAPEHPRGQHQGRQQGGQVKIDIIRVFGG